LEHWGGVSLGLVRGSGCEYLVQYLAEPVRRERPNDLADDASLLIEEKLLGHAGHSVANSGPAASIQYVGVADAVPLDMADHVTALIPDGDADELHSLLVLGING